MEPPGSNSGELTPFRTEDSRGTLEMPGTKQRQFPEHAAATCEEHLEGAATRVTSSVNVHFLKNQYYKVRQRFRKSEEP